MYNQIEFTLNIEIRARAYIWAFQHIQYSTNNQLAFSHVSVM